MPFRKFDNKQFWNNRYLKSPSLGSGPGSRGEIAILKSRNIQDIVLNNSISSILDYGCGDLHCIDPCLIEQYVGVDLSEIVLEKNRKLFPNKKFITPQELDDDRFDLVVCQDVLIHQDTKDKFMYIFNTCLSKTNKIFLFSTLTSRKDSRHNVFYYDLDPQFLQEQVSNYRDVTTYIYRVQT